VDEGKVIREAWNVCWRAEALNTAAKSKNWKEFKRLFHDVKQFVDIIHGELQKEGES
jgi:hypothetical protein